MKKSTSKVITGFFLGAAAGTIFALLYAPDKGSNTRKKIRKAADEIALEATSNLNQQTKNMKVYAHAFLDVMEGMFKLFVCNLREGLLEQMDDAEMLLKEHSELRQS